MKDPELRKIVFDLYRTGWRPYVVDDFKYYIARPSTYQKDSWELQSVSSKVFKQLERLQHNAGLK